MPVQAETRESRAMFNLAMEKMHRCHFAGALRDLQEAMSIVPEQPLYLSYYGVCLAQQRQFEPAVDSCKRALGLAPDDTLLQVNLGKVHRLRGETRTAYRVFLRAWQGDKSHPAAAAELARMGVRRPPVLRFLPRSHLCNRWLGKLRFRLERALAPRRSIA